MSGKFEIYKDKAGQFRFRLKASNGQIILVSEGYKSKSGCSNGVRSIQHHASNDKFYQRKETRNGKFSFNLTAANHHIIGSSETYESVAARENGINSVKKNVPNANIKDLAS